jgi:hypothetical protein
MSSAADRLSAIWGIFGGLEQKVSKPFSIEIRGSGDSSEWRHIRARALPVGRNDMARCASPFWLFAAACVLSEILGWLD